MKSPIIFRVFKNNQIHFVKQFIDKDQIVFGSSLDSGAEVDVDLESKEVSAIHCLVEKRGSQFYLCDLGSSQGTYKNGQVVLDEALNTNDEFQVGPFKVVFFVGVPKPVHNQETSSELVVSAKPSEPPVRTVPVVTPPPPAPAVAVVPPAPTQPKPTINAAFVGQRAVNKNAAYARIKKSKNQKTFAPSSEHQNLNEFIKPGQGSLVQVIVSWKERVLSTHHFEPTGQYRSGPDQAIQLPQGAAPKDWVMLDCSSGVVVRMTQDMKSEVHRAEDIMVLSESNYRLQQNEVLFVQLPNGMQLAIRFAPKTKLIPLDSPLILTSSEFTGILAASIFAVLLSLIMSVLAPKATEQEEEVQRVAQVIFNKPPVPVNPPVIPVPPPKPPEVQPPPPPKPPEPPKKVAITDKVQEVKTKGDPKKQEQKAQAASSSGRASEVKPKDSKLKTKMFTSTKQGGAVKTGPKAGANAQSKEPDPTNAGLLSAFGSGGARSQLDKAYSGSGEALGAGEKATGASGFNENRAGNDLGSKFKDTGAGGKGTATQGIAGVGTKGGTGYGTGTGGSGFGNKDSVAIQAGGAEEEFIGSIDKEAVRRAVRSALLSFKACYDREYKKDTKLEGKVVISWEIHEKGVAKNARVLKDKSTLGNAAVEECVRARLLTLRFPEPPPGAMAEAVYPFLFQGQR